MRRVLLTLALLVGSSLGSGLGAADAQAGSAQDAPTLEALLSAYHERAAQDESASTPCFRRSLRRAVACAVQAAPEEARPLLGRLDGLDPTTTVAVIEGLADAGVREALASLSELLRRRPELRAFTLDALERLARRLGGPHDAELLEGVRSALEALEREVVVAAARAAGALRDDEAVPYLIELLRSEEGAVAAASLAALVEHSGFDYGDEPDHWQRWYDGERRFLDEELPRLERVLVHGAPEQRATAIKAVAAGRLGVHDRAEVLVMAYPYLGGTALRLQAIAGLATLGSSVALPLLEDLLATETDRTLLRAAVRAAADLAAH